MTNHADVCYQDVFEAINQLPRSSPLTVEQFLETLREVLDTYFETLPVSRSGGSPAPAKSTPSKSPANWQAVINSKEYGLSKYFPEQWEELKAEHPKMGHWERVSLLRDQIEPDRKAWLKYTATIRKMRPDLPAEIPVRGAKKKSPALATITTPIRSIALKKSSANSDSDDETPPTIAKTSTKRVVAIKKPVISKQAESDSEPSTPVTTKRVVRPKKSETLAYQSDSDAEQQPVEKPKKRAVEPKKSETLAYQSDSDAEQQPVEKPKKRAVEPKKSETLAYQSDSDSEQQAPKKSAGKMTIQPVVDPSAFPPTIDITTPSP